jgi:hypothetical protein
LQAASAAVAALPSQEFYSCCHFASSASCSCFSFLFFSLKFFFPTFASAEQCFFFFFSLFLSQFFLLPLLYCCISFLSLFCSVEIYCCYCCIILSSSSSLSLWEILL